MARPRKIGRNLKSEIRNIKLDKRFVQSDISDFGFEIPPDFS
jgi:hypothetical protein